MPDLDPTSPAAEPELSIADHEAQFVADKPSHTDDLRLHVEKAPPAATDAVSDESTAAPGRDASGKFVPKHVAKSHRATREDVPRIQELTRRLRETEAKYADLEKQRPAPVGAPVVTPAPVAAPVARAPQVEKPPAKGEPAPEPKLADFEDWDKYFDARTDWKIGEARRVERDENARVASMQEFSRGWREKVAAAKAVYPDFEEVAFQRETYIPEDGLIDHWVREHKNGVHLLYHLQNNPAELTRLLALDQSSTDLIDELSQLALRLVPSRSPGVATGAPAARVLHPGPRPPTPVRTAPTHAVDEPPGDDATLAQHERYFHPEGSRRRR